jgi:hypothetical protein
VKYYLLPGYPDNHIGEYFQNVQNVPEYSQTFSKRSGVSLNVCEKINLVVKIKYVISRAKNAERKKNKLEENMSLLQKILQRFSKGKHMYYLTFKLKQNNYNRIETKRHKATKQCKVIILFDFQNFN